MPPTTVETVPTFEEQTAAEEQALTSGDGTTELETSEQQPPAPTGDAVSLTNLSAREKALVELARREEKTKLYNQLREARRQVKDAQDALRQATASTPSGNTDTASELRELRDMVTNLHSSLEQERRESRIRQYRTEKLADARAQGMRVIESLVTGDTEDEIDITFDIAVQEARQIESDIRKEMAVPPTTGTPTTAPRRVVVQNNRASVPNVVPVTPARPSANGDGSGDGYSAAEIKQLTSMESLRDGTWARVRTEVLKAIKEGRVRP